MILIDSSGWLEYFSDGSNASIFAKAIFDRKETIIVPTIVIYEVFKKVIKEAGEEMALQTVSHLKHFKIIPLTENLAIEAANISHTYKLPMADSFIYASAQTCDAVIWTQDEHFQNLPNVKYIKKQIL